MSIKKVSKKYGISKYIVSFNHGDYTPLHVTSKRKQKYRHLNLYVQVKDGIMVCTYLKMKLSRTEVEAIDKNKPKYQALKEYIVEMIRQETFKPGEKILSENELADKFEISRHTVRQAIGELVNEKWLYRIKGKGTFIDKRPDWIGSCFFCVEIFSIQY